MRACLHVCMYTDAHMCACAYVNVMTFLCMNVYIHILYYIILYYIIYYIYIYTHICIYIYIYIYIFVVAGHSQGASVMGYANDY